RDAGRLAAIPGVMVQGRLVAFCPTFFAWLVTRDWPDARLEIVESGGHGGGHGISERVVAALDAFAAAPGPAA
ncbi:prolyl aminopeptidase, partial [Micromonospora chalcea]